MQLNKYIDHTILKQGATADQVIKLCAEAREHGFASVCVNPSRLALVVKELAGTDVKPCVVVGFPLGAALPEAKAHATKALVALGAKEVDMVVDVGAIKDKNWDFVQKDIEGVVAAAKPGAIVKVILETCLLTDEEKIKACEICKAAGADFVKTSTGFSTGGATIEDVKLMRATVGPEMGVKASGGIRTKADALAMIEAGASRLGTSAGIAIISSSHSPRR